MIAHTGYFFAGGSCVTLGREKIRSVGRSGLVRGLKQKHILDRKHLVCRYQDSRAIDRLGCEHSGYSAKESQKSPSSPAHQDFAKTIEIFHSVLGSRRSGLAERQSYEFVLQW